MANRSIEPFTAGLDILSPEFRARLEAMREAVMRNEISVAEGSGLFADRWAGGVAIGEATRLEVWGKLTGHSGANYAWTEQVRSGGAWTNGSRTGTTSAQPFIEANGITTISVTGNVIVKARLSIESNELIFQGDNC